MNLLPKLTSELAGINPRRARPLISLGRVAAMLAIVAIAAVGYALYQDITADPGITAVEDANLITTIDETKPVTGYDAATEHQLQVTLDYAYADANRITVVYTVSGTSAPDTPIFISNNPRLLRGNGAEFRRMLLGTYGDPETTTDAHGNTVYRTTMVSNFDASPVQDAPETLDLQLIVDAAVSYPQSGDAMRMDMGGSASFDFSVPFLPGRVTDAQQTASASGIDMTLQTVVVTPSLTRLTLCYPDPEPAGQLWAVDGELAVDGETVVENLQLNEPGPHGEFGDDSSACQVLIIPASLYDQNGEWTLTITDLRLPGSEDQAAVVQDVKAKFGVEIEALDDGTYVTDNDAEAQALHEVLRADAQTIDGPWVFTFTLPPK